MSNIVTIESKPAGPASRVCRRRVAALRDKGLQVTDSAIKRIRIAMAKEGVSPKRVVCASA